MIYKYLQSIGISQIIARYPLLILLLFSSFSVFSQSAKVNKVWLEHGTQKNGNKGMTIHADINVYGMKGKKIKSIAYFYDKNKSKLLGGVSGYKTTDGQVSASNYGTPSYENSHFSDFDIFIPYNSLPLASGKQTYYVLVDVFDTEKDVFLSDSRNYVSFTGTGDSNNSNGNRLVQNEEYGSSPVHGKILKRTQTRNGDCTIQTEWYADGYVSTASTIKCTNCSGSKRCSSCGGTGRGMMGWNCPYCYGTGTCNWCHGVGVFVTVTGSYENESSGSYAGASSGGISHPSSNSNSKSNSNSNSSVYTKCTSCNGTGICSGCGGKRGSWQNTGTYIGEYIESWIDCGSCRGSGKCPICYGRGKL